MHKIEEYISRLKNNDLLLETNIDLDKYGSTEINYISYDSNDIKNETLFICKGNNFKEEYLTAALKKGAISYVSEKKYDSLPDNIFYILVSDIRKAMSHIADFYYNSPWKKLKTIGITGTKGKSTVAYYVKSILDEYSESAILSGIDVYDGVVNEESHLTTPETFDLYKHFHNAVQSEIPYLEMEVSSQALKYDRTYGIVFDVVSFLNIGMDHISDIEHSDFDDYYSSKLKIFDQCKIACVNIDADSQTDIRKHAQAHAPKVLTFGINPKADIYGHDIIKTNEGFVFKVKTPTYDWDFEIGMSGFFNISNALAAIAMTYSLDIPVEYIEIGLRKARASGRMEVYRNDQKFVIVDYAHNQMSFEALFESVKKEYPAKKISIVFGCPGKKALGRRRELGEIAGKGADRIYLTEEDAGLENVEDISREIGHYISAVGGNFQIINNREKAIKQAIEDADEETVILVTGKGRETRQKRQ